MASFSSPAAAFVRVMISGAILSVGLGSWAQSDSAFEVVSGYRIKTGDFSCGGFPRVDVTTPEGVCAGLVVGQKQGLKMPRYISEMPNGDMILTDMGGWSLGRGRVYLLRWDRSSRRVVVHDLFPGASLDMPNGVAVLDGRVYVGTPFEIFSFDPYMPRERGRPAVHPPRVTEISDLPRPRELVAAGRHKHPLTTFAFGPDRALYVNLGAPSDHCEDALGAPRATEACVQTEGPVAQAAIRVYVRGRDGRYGTPQVMARGLRNSMGLAVHPRSGVILQAENSRDLKDADRPPEELNVIRRGQHYGWPYCFGDDDVSEEYASTRTSWCRSTEHARPAVLMPAHAAPLGLAWYFGSLFPQLEGKVIVGWHGYRPTGQRLVAYDTTADGVPLAPRSGERPLELIGGWQARAGRRPLGSPVGVAIARDGAIWVVEDKAPGVLRMARPTGPNPWEPGRKPQEPIRLSERSLALATRLQADFFESCVGCHSLKSGAPAENARWLIENDWVRAGDRARSKIWQRLVMAPAARRMPPGASDHDPAAVARLGEFIDSLK